MHEQYMRLALAEAYRASSLDEVPVGAVIVKNSLVIASAFNLRETSQSPTAHAEILAINAASQRIGSWRLDDCVLYVTLEPCPMCAGAIVLARVPKVVFGAFDPKAGAVRSLFGLLDDPRLNHRCEWTGGVLADECGAVLTGFFRAKRKFVPGPEG